MYRFKNYCAVVLGCVCICEMLYSELCTVSSVAGVRARRLVQDVVQCLLGRAGHAWYGCIDVCL